MKIVSASYNPNKRFFLLLILMLIAGLLSLGWIKQEHALIHAFDSGIYLQLLSNLQAGRGWSSSITGEENFLAHHFQPAVALILPAFALAPKVSMLFGVSAMSCLVSIWILWRRFSASIPPRFLISAFILFLVHPTISFRMMHSFVPEIMALPSLFVAAICLDKGVHVCRMRFWIYALIMFFAGFTKETIWPVLGFVCVLQGITWKAKRFSFLMLGIFFILIFVYLVGFWMPNHTSLPSYYGLRYYLEEGASRPSGILDWIGVLIKNLTSSRALQTLFVNIGLPLFFVPLLGSRRVLAGALPGLAFILLSAHAIVHDPRNHYQLLSLPFLVVAMLTAFEKRSLLHSNEIKRWLPFLLPLPCLLFYLLPGIFEDFQRIKLAETAAYISSDLELARRGPLTDPSKNVIVDANLQPMLPDFWKLRVLLPFVGNPMAMKTSDYQSADYIVTLVDARSLDCEDFRGRMRQGDLYDYDAFFEYCTYLKSSGISAEIFPRSKLIIYSSK